LRVISGKYGGRVLKGKMPKGTRPTTDKSRESLFSVLNNYIYFEGKRVLDCYAGSGLVGIEFLSRGSDFCTFIEKGGKQISNLKSFLSELNVPSNDYNLIKSDVLKFLNSEPELPYNIIFSDAPYDLKSANDIIQTVENNKWLANEGFLILETSKEETVKYSEQYILVKEKIFGISKLTILEYSDD
jgi:16S rRNA (guanine966-N2)-methyltransferase